MESTTLKKGDPAPHFKAKDQNGNWVELKQFQGKKLILYFYPKDSTPGCTTEACNFRDHYEDLLEKGYEVVGVSVDSEKSHQKFIEKHTLPFILLADTDQELVNRYGVWQEKNNFGVKYMGTVRKTFVIDEQGYIRHIVDKVNNAEATQQILALD